MTTAERVLTRIDRLIEMLQRANIVPPRGIVLTNDEFWRFKVETASWLPFSASGNVTKYRGILIQAEIPTYPPID